MEPTLLKGDHHGMGAVLCLELLEQGLDMGFDCFLADKQGFGNFDIALALAQFHQHIPFPLGEQAAQLGITAVVAAVWGGAASE